MRIMFFLILLMSLQITCYGHELYYLCGSDEDGCSPLAYEGCLCSPNDGALSSKPYCLDLDNVSCVPLSKMPNCRKDYIIKDQASCLAVAYQSEPDPPCLPTTKEFCVKHHIALCQQDGGQDSCLPTT